MITFTRTARCILIAASALAIAAPAASAKPLGLVNVPSAGSTDGYQGTYRPATTPLVIGSPDSRDRVGTVNQVTGIHPLPVATKTVVISSSFDWTAGLLHTVARSDGGYLAFTLARYGICLAVMLPATFCAGITLPLFAAKKQRNQIAEAEARVTAESAAIDALTRDLTIRTRDRAASLEAATKTAVLYNEKLLPLDEISMQSALSGYQSGKLPFVAVLDALHMLHDDRVAHTAHVADAAKWRAAIEEAKP